MLKNILSTFLILLSFNSIASSTIPISLEKQEELLKKQNEYISILESLEDKYLQFNIRLSNCREFYFKTASKEEKEEYLKSTEEFSKSILILQSLVSQASSNIKDKMNNDLNSVLLNLNFNYEKLEETLEFEKNRKEKLIKNTNLEFSKIQDKYCK